MTITPTTNSLIANTRESGQGGCSAGVVTAIVPPTMARKIAHEPTKTARLNRVGSGHASAAMPTPTSPVTPRTAKAPERPEKRRRDHEVQCPPRQQRQTDECCQRCERPINGHQRHSGDDSHATGDGERPRRRRHRLSLGAASRGQALGVHPRQGRVERCVLSFLDRADREVHREYRVVPGDVSVSLSDLDVVFGSLRVDVLTNGGHVVIPVLLHTGPPVGDVLLVGFGVFPRFLCFGLRRLPSRLDVLFELGTRLALRGSNAFFCFFGACRELGQLIGEGHSASFQGLLVASRHRTRHWISASAVTTSTLDPRAQGRRSRSWQALVRSPRPGRRRPPWTRSS
jgi:hypothetical protein